MKDLAPLLALLSIVGALAGIPSVQASIPRAPETPLPEWGPADPRPPGVDRTETLPPSHAGKRARVLETLFADPGVDVYDLRIGQGPDGSLRVRSVSGGDLIRASRLVGEKARQESAPGTALPLFCRKAESSSVRAGDIDRCVRLALAAEPGAFVDRVRTRYDGGTGTLVLEGRAYHLEARKVAERAVRRVGWIRAVDNRLDASPAVPREDSRMEEELRGRIEGRQDLETAVIQVRVRDGVVVLAGVVPDQERRALVYSLAAQIRGVREVREDGEPLRVGGP